MSFMRNTASPEGWGDGECPVKAYNALCYNDIARKRGRWRSFYEIFLEAPYFVLKKTRVEIYLSTRHGE